MVKQEYHIKGNDVPCGIFKNIKEVVEKNVDLKIETDLRCQLYDTLIYGHPNETRVKIQSLTYSQNEEIFDDSDEKDNSSSADLKIQFTGKSEIEIIEARRDLEYMVRGLDFQNIKSITK